MAIKAYTDLEQSKKLAEILPIDSADHFHIIVPCWSLAALLDILPKIHGLKPILDLEECSIQYNGIDLYVVASNPIDACVEMIVKLHGLNLL